MATITQSVLDKAFDVETQQAMKRDDSQAWTAVTGILFVIVTGGALLGLVGVLLSW